VVADLLVSGRNLITPPSRELDQRQASIPIDRVLPAEQDALPSTVAGRRMLVLLVHCHGSSPSLTLAPSARDCRVSLTGQAPAAPRVSVGKAAPPGAGPHQRPSTGAAGYNVAAPVPTLRPRP